MEVKNKMIIRRYIPIKYIDCFINCRKLKLSDYHNWHDVEGKDYRCDNTDYLMVEEYMKREYGEGTSTKLGIMCFSNTTNEYSQWIRYADCCNGFCISFHRNELEIVLRKKFGDKIIGFKEIEYVQMRNDIEPIPYSELPFIKRKAYEGESEIRFITKLDENDSYFIEFTDEEMRNIVDRITIGSCVDDKNSIIERVRDKGIACYESRVLHYDKWFSYIRNHLQQDN